MTAPSIKVVGMHIKQLRSIRALELPRDGMGWEVPFPDLVMIGGVNGSGKTTLLEFLFEAVQHLFDTEFRHPGPGVFQRIPPTTEAWVDFQIVVPGGDATFAPPDGIVRYLVGGQEFVDSHRTENAFGFQFNEGGSKRQTMFRNAMINLQKEFPGVLFVTCDRDLIIPEETYKAPGKVTVPDEVLYRWHAPIDWKQSLEARLYSARWADLNAKEQGRPEDAHHFEAYSREFERFFEGRKKFQWTVDGELIVETKSGSRHDLFELSSGEKQVVTLMGEILYRWRPGSLILIDEPELHLHASWQGQLWEALLHWQKERGGQVIVTTQSNWLFRMSEPGNKVLLGGANLA